MVRRTTRALVSVVAVVTALAALLAAGSSAVPAQAAGTRQVTFVVTTTDGRPVVGSWVSWSALDGSASAGVQKQTDGSGRVTFLAVPMTPVSLRAIAASRGIPIPSEVIGGQVAGAGTLTELVDTSVDIPASGDVAVDAGPAPTAVVQDVVVQMPDGTPVPGAVLQARPITPDGHDGTWLFRYDPGYAAAGDRKTWTACPYGSACNYLVWDTAASPWAYRMPTGSDGVAHLWRFDRSQSTPDAACPFVASFNDGELSQNAAFDCVASGPIVVNLPYMPAVRIESTPAPVDAGQPAVVTARAVDGTGAPLAGVTVGLGPLGAARTSAGAARTAAGKCRPEASGKTGADGRVVLKVCPTTTGLWQADGPSLVPSRAVKVTVRPTGASNVRMVPGKGRMALQWDPPVGLPAGTTATYSVSAKGAKGCTTSKTSCVVSGLTNGKRYTFTLRTTAGGQAFPPMKIKATPGTPAAPGKVKVKATSDGLVVSWRKPSSTGGKKVVGYLVKAGSRSCRTNGATSCVVTGLQKGKTYDVTVVARNATGTGVESAPVTSPTVKG